MPWQSEARADARGVVGHAARPAGLAGVVHFGQLRQRFDRAEHHAFHVVHGADDFRIQAPASQQFPDRIGDVGAVTPIVVVVRLGLFRDEQYRGETTAIEHRA